MSTDGWKDEVKLGLLIEHQKGFAFKSSEYELSGHPVIRVSNFTDRSIDTSDCKFISPSKVKDYDAFTLNQGDVVIATVGSWPSNPASVVGKTVCVPSELDGALLNQNSVRLRSNGRIDQKFLFHLLKTQDFQDYIIGTAQGSANQASITLKAIFDFTFSLPPLDEQKAIAHILGTLDDKIELNQQMNRTLEAIARALFKSWFIDFDPVRAKMDGRQPAGIDAETAALFPAEFEDSVIGKIPKDWSVSPFEDLFLVPVRNGLTKPSSVRGNGTYMVNMGELFANRRIGDIPMDRVPLTEKEAEKFLLEVGDLVFARRSLKWDGAGQCSIIVEAQEPRTFEGSLIRCRIDPEKASPWFYFYYFWLPEGRSRIESIIEQVAVAGIRGSDLAKLQVLAPPNEILKKFDAVVSKMEKRIAADATESQTLASIRDALLPKLLAGEICVRDAGKVVEAVA